MRRRLTKTVRALFAGRAEPLEFEAFALVEYGAAAGSTVYEAKRTDGGVHLEYCFDTSGYNGGEKYVCNAIDGGEETYRSLSALLGKCRVKRWDGYKGVNRLALDGGGFFFDCVLADGSSISARGSNARPGNYGAFRRALTELLAYGTVSDTVFEGRGFRCRLPESWAGRMRIFYSVSHIVFQSDLDGRALPYLIIDDGIEQPGGGALAIGVLRAEGKNDRYLCLRAFEGLDDCAERMSEEQRAMHETLAEDIRRIAQTLEGCGGYTLERLDG